MASLERLPALPESYMRLRPKHDDWGNEASGQAWNFQNGDPELFTYIDQIVKPGGSVLDLGCGDLRNSLMFTLFDMQVTGVDTNPHLAAAMNTDARKRNLPARVIKGDIEDFCAESQQQYDFVLLSQVLIHSPSREHALGTLATTYDMVAPEGHLWIRAVGKHDDNFTVFTEVGADRLDQDTFEVACSCSGSLQLDPVMFFDPLDVHQALAERGAEFVHSEVLPATAKANIMYGEDYEPAREEGERGFISVLARKPSA